MLATRVWLAGGIGVVVVTAVMLVISRAGDEPKRLSDEQSAVLRACQASVHPAGFCEQLAPLGSRCIAGDNVSCLAEGQSLLRVEPYVPPPLQLACQRGYPASCSLLTRIERWQAMGWLGNGDHSTEVEIAQACRARDPVACLFAATRMEDLEERRGALAFACESGVYDACLASSRLAARSEDAVRWQQHACDDLQIAMGCFWTASLLRDCEAVRRSEDRTALKYSPAYGTWSDLRCPAVDRDRANEYFARGNALLHH